MFQDDFTAAQLDGGKWSATTDAANNELSQRLPANVLPGAEHLTIRAQRQAYGSREFTSGYVTTAGRFSVPSGQWLIRARWDDSYGLWPALWLRDDTGLGEIDIMEAVGSVRKIVQTVHRVAVMIESVSACGGWCTAWAPPPAATPIPHAGRRA